MAVPKLPPTAVGYCPSVAFSCVNLISCVFFSAGVPDEYRLLYTKLVKILSRLFSARAAATVPRLLDV